MTRAPTSLLPVLAVALWPVQGYAQEGPSFNCRYAQTATEVAICASPDLAQLEMRMYDSYLRLVEAVGERRARRIADRFLERRQACGGDEACISKRLEITMRVFERRAGGGTELAAVDPTEEELSGDAAPIEERPVAEAVPEAIPEPAPEDELVAVVSPPSRPEALGVPEPAPEPDLAALEPPEPAPVEDLAALEPPELAPAPEAEPAAEPPAAEPDLPLAAQAPLPPDLDPLLEEEAPDLAATEPLPAPEAIDEAIDEAELASSDEAPAAEETELAATEDATAADEAPAAEETEVAATEEAAATDEVAAASEPAPFDQPISWAFMDLIRSDRAEIQARLREAGYYEGPAEGSWDRATLDAIEAFLASEEGAGFDVASESGATLALDFLRSDAFAEAHGLAPAEEPEPEPAAPLISTEW